MGIGPIDWTVFLEGPVVVVAMIFIMVVMFQLVKMTQSNNASAQDARDMMEATINSLEAQVNQLVGRLDETTNRLNQTTDRAIKGEFELGRLKNLLEDALRDKERAEEERDAAVRRVATLEEENQAMRADLTGLHASLKKLQARIQQLEGILHQHGITIPADWDELTNEASAEADAA